jgi:hypothetical protein
VVYHIQQHLRVKVMMAHLDRLAPYLGATWDEEPKEVAVSQTYRMRTRARLPPPPHTHPSHNDVSMLHVLAYGSSSAGLQTVRNIAICRHVARNILASLDYSGNECNIPAPFAEVGNSLWLIVKWKRCWQVDSEVLCSHVPTEWHE